MPNINQFFQQIEKEEVDVRKDLDALHKLENPKEREQQLHQPPLDIPPITKNEKFKFK